MDPKDSLGNQFQASEIRWLRKRSGDRGDGSAGIGTSCQPWCPKFLSPGPHDEKKKTTLHVVLWSSHEHPGTCVHIYLDICTQGISNCNKKNHFIFQIKVAKEVGGGHLMGKTMSSLYCSTQWGHSQCLKAHSSLPREPSKWEWGITLWLTCPTEGSSPSLLLCFLQISLMETRNPPSTFVWCYFGAGPIRRPLRFMKP